MKKTYNQPVHIVFNIPDSDGRLIQGSEADGDTLDSAMEMKNTLEGCGVKTYLAPVSQDDLSSINGIKSGVIFNLIEWTGRDIKPLKKAMEKIERSDIPYTGSDFRGLYLSINKVLMKREFVRLGIPTPDYQVFITGEERIHKGLTFPVIVKPAYEHCGIGVSQSSVVNNRTQLRKKVREYTALFRQPILAEEYIDGREIMVTVLEHRLQPVPLEPIEIEFNQKTGDRPIFTYEAKWYDDRDEYRNVRVRPADLPDKVSAKMKNIAKSVYKNMGGKDYPRLDIRLRGEEIYVLEVNNNPEIDFTFQGSLGMAADKAGMNHAGFLQHVIDNTVYRFAAEAHESIRI